ncbi:MAG TPA: redoxin domain-containing protein [Actinobacteria bacterium]|nr:redoxin domain-containing protein [Actinomycetota bacterium]
MTRRARPAAWGAIAAAVAVVGLGIVFAGRFGTDPTIASSPLIGKPVPAVSMPDFDGNGTIDLAALEGDVVVVNFWASWCLACREEHPALVAAAEAYADFGVTFVGVNYQDRRDAAEAFLAELGRGGPNYRYGVDEDSTVAFAFGVLGLPETFFVDRDGIVVGKISGPTSYELLARTLDDVILGKAVESVRTGEVENR